MKTLGKGDPICFNCKWFVQTNPDAFLVPGFCSWDQEKVPVWVRKWLAIQDRYVGPKREITTGMTAIKRCAAFEQKS